MEDLKRLVDYIFNNKSVLPRSIVLATKASIILVIISMIALFLIVLKTVANLLVQ